MILDSLLCQNSLSLSLYTMFSTFFSSDSWQIGRNLCRFRGTLQELYAIVTNVSCSFMVLSVQRNSIEAASNFVCRNRLPPRLKEQILAYMCLRFKAENLNQHQLIEQLPKSICKSICQHLFFATVEKVYLFKDVSKEILLSLVWKTKLDSNNCMEPLCN